MPGARLGTEVRALHRLGHFAVGIDLEPGPDNHYVLPGDFHHIVFPDGSIDAIYTNALDHVFDLERVLGEVARLLRPGGLFIADIELGYEEASSRANSRPLIGESPSPGREAYRDHPLRLENPDELDKHDRWAQVVLRKPYADD